MTQLANDIQVGGNHYKSGLQHWDFCAASFGPGYFRGNATKYLARWRKKNGLEDLKKAHHYVQKMTEVDWELMGFSLTPYVSPQSVGGVIDFCVANDVPAREAVIITMIANASTKPALYETLRDLDELIADAEQEATDKAARE